MTAEQVFKLYRAYKFYYSGNYDFKKYGGNINAPPLLQQRDRQFYYRIAQKLNDEQIHGLFTSGFFFKPKAYVSDFATPDALNVALTFASRAENGRTLLEHDLYELEKTHANDMQDWLFTDAAVPACMQDVISGSLPLDLACLLLLIPMKHHDYQWTKYWEARPEASLGLGVQPWIDRLKKVDQLIVMQRPGWRLLAFGLAKEFWSRFDPTCLKPMESAKSHELFTGD